MLSGWRIISSPPHPPFFPFGIFSFYFTKSCFVLCRLLVGSLEILEMNLENTDLMTMEEACQGGWRDKAVELATNLLTLPTPSGVQQNVKGLLDTLFTDHMAYHFHLVSNFGLRWFPDFANPCLVCK